LRKLSRHDGRLSWFLQNASDPGRQRVDDREWQPGAGESWPFIIHAAGKAATHPFRQPAIRVAMPNWLESGLISCTVERDSCVGCGGAQALPHPAHWPFCVAREGWLQLERTIRGVDVASIPHQWLGAGAGAAPLQVPNSQGPRQGRKVGARPGIPINPESSMQETSLCNEQGSAGEIQERPSNDSGPLP
jgi:hypothetical protein